MDIALQQPVIETHAVLIALEALHQARSLGAEHPLAHFVSLSDAWTPPFPVESVLASDVRIFDGLCRIIEQGLTASRSFHNMTAIKPLPDKARALEALRDDFRCGSMELEAWSLLYYRYVCVQLDLSLDQIARLVGQTKRTLHRRQQHGLLRLTQTLVRSERLVRAQRLQWTLRTQLPSVFPPALVGRDLELALMLKALGASRGPRHVLLYGASGVGKSTLALAAAHRLIDQAAIRAVIWLQRPPRVWWELAQTITNQLGVLWSGSDADLSHLLHSTNILVILDNAQAIIDNPDLVTKLRHFLSAAHLIVCAEVCPVSDVGIAYLRVPELGREAALTVFEQQTLCLNLADEAQLLDQFDQLYAELGGNPGAIHTALVAGRRSGATVISATGSPSMASIGN